MHMYMSLLQLLGSGACLPLLCSRCLLSSLCSLCSLSSALLDDGRQAVLTACLCSLKCALLGDGRQNVLPASRRLADCLCLLALADRRERGHLEQ